MTPLTSDFLSSSVVFLSAAVIAVPLAQRAGLGSVLGYLLAGIAIGPWGLGLIRDVQAIMHFAEFGVVLLLFLIGLELNPKKLWNLRGPILGLGGAQVVVTTAVLSSVAYLLGVSWQSALVIGMALALSSTAIALRVIEEHGLTRTEAGQIGICGAAVSRYCGDPHVGTAANPRWKQQWRLAECPVDDGRNCCFVTGRTFSA